MEKNPKVVWLLGDIPHLTIDLFPDVVAKKEMSITMSGLVSTTSGEW